MINSDLQVPAARVELAYLVLQTSVIPLILYWLARGTSSPAPRDWLLLPHACMGLRPESPTGLEPACPGLQSGR